MSAEARWGVELLLREGASFYNEGRYVDALRAMLDELRAHLAEHEAASTPR